MSSVRPVDGIRATAHTAGSGPPDLVFLHGWAGSAAYFDETIAALDLDQTRVVALDLSGHGDCPPTDGEWSLDGIDDAVLEAADAAGCERFIAVGFSMGGKFVQHLAVSHPERIAGLILIAGTPAAALELPPEMLEDWYACAGSEPAMKDLVRGFITDAVDEAAFERFGRDAARVPRSGLEGTLRVTLDGDFADALPTLDVPTLVVAGGRDELFTVDVLRAAIVEPIQRARLTVVDCGHEIPLERPRELAGLIEAFLAGLRD